MSACAEPECGRTRYARGVCRKHYTALWRREGRITPEDRFSRSFEITERGCWLWAAHTDRKGYPILADGTGGKVRAHRWAWETYVGELAPDEQVHHLCDQPSCVNPDHLEPMSNTENQRRRWSRKHRYLDCGSMNVEPTGDLDITVT